MTYAQFKSKWLGKRIDIDKIYGYQCVDLAKQYMKETAGVPDGAYGNAIDYWYKPHKNVLAKYIRVSGSSARQGDLVVLKGINGNPYGHIGVADGNAGPVTVTILEQNGATGSGSGLGGDAIRTRAIPRWRVIGLLRPRSATPLPVYHTVKKGETASGISKAYGISLDTFKKLNPSIKNVNLIYPGQRVRVK